MSRNIFTFISKVVYSPIMILSGKTPGEVKKVFDDYDRSHQYWENLEKTLNKKH